MSSEPDAISTQAPQEDRLEQGTFFIRYALSRKETLRQEALPGQEYPTRQEAHSEQEALSIQEVIWTGGPLWIGNPLPRMPMNGRSLPTKKLPARRPSPC